ncbi:hypothetical protein FRC07_013710 [Ceratobasidium sp. 392]|nr:hypothetical protein FRC07_013710 [Ceratobasidium sp. 392]
MPKLTPYECRYCGKGCTTVPGLEQHISQQPKCLAKRLKERNTDLSAKARVAQGRPLPTIEPNPVAAASDGDEMDWEPTVDRTPSPRGMWSMTLEEVQDEYENLYEAEEPAVESPRQNRSVTIEEVEDEDAPDVYFGPHPYAKPTRPTLFPQPHPNNAAGAAFHFDDIDAQIPALYMSRLAEVDVFKEAAWLDSLPISDAAKDEYLRLPWTRGWYWNNTNEFEREIHSLPRGPRWYRETVKVYGDQGEEILDLWKRSIPDAIRFLLGNKRFLSHMRFAPEQHFDSETGKQVYDEMWSGLWWWQMQNLLGPYATIAPLIIATDKSKMTVFSENQKAWPVYASLGNISGELRRKPSEHAMILIGFIPVSNLSNISDPTERSECRWQLYHSCMESILEPLKELSRLGMDVRCADGGLRRVFPILAIHIANFPEQALISCVRESFCPICWVPREERADKSARYPKQDRGRTLDALCDHINGYSRTIETLGIRPTRPFWVDLPYADIHTCLAPDLLHQLDKGVFGDHVLSWCTALIGKTEMDRRMKGMPRFQRLRHFARGISVISMWTGKEAKALACTLLSAVAACNKPAAVTATRCMLDFLHCAYMPELSEDDLARMEDDLLEFDEVKNVFVNANIPGLLKREDQFYRIAKFHMLTHYFDLIRQFGAPMGYNTETTKQLHIDYVKEPWRASNRVNPLQQMVAYLQRKEAWTLLRAYLHDLNLLIDYRFAKENNDDEEEQGPEDVIEGNGRGGNGGSWQSSPAITVAKRPGLGTKPSTYLISKHEAADLVPATIHYLRDHVPPGTSLPLFPESNFKVWKQFKLHHQRLPFYPALAAQTDQVRAFPPSIDKEGRLIRAGHFDVILFSPSTNNNGNPQGLHSLQAARVRAIFELPRQLHRLWPKKLVYIEHFGPFPILPSRATALYTTSHAVSGGRRSVSVIPLSQVRMTCHLTPRYNLLDPDYGISALTDLLSEHNRFFLNKYASYWIFVVLEYWEKQRRLNGRNWCLASFRGAQATLAAAHFDLCSWSDMEANSRDLGPNSTNLFCPADTEYYPPFPPNPPSSRPFSFGETLSLVCPPHGLSTPAPAVLTSHLTMDTSGNTSLPRNRLVPVSPMTPPLTLLFGSEISGDNMSKDNGWTARNVALSGRSNDSSGFDNTIDRTPVQSNIRSGTHPPSSSSSLRPSGYSWSYPLVYTHQMCRNPLLEVVNSFL